MQIECLAPEPHCLYMLVMEICASGLLFVFCYNLIFTCLILYFELSRLMSQWPLSVVNIIVLNQCIFNINVYLACYPGVIIRIHVLMF